jgi:hypothetical protein
MLCHSLPGVHTRRRTGGKLKGLPERKGWSKAKKIVFYTSEASILLKTNGRGSYKKAKQLVLRRDLDPKCTPIARFFEFLIPFPLPRANF